MLCEHGFSTYTCLPAARAKSVAGACQWSGVATVTASTAYQDMKGRRLDAATFFAQAAGREVKARGAWNGATFVADQLALKN